jgi:hypothetical protein
MNDLPLRDIHLPDPVLWWPPAPGWWLLLALTIGAGLIIWYWRSSGFARRQLYRQALAELDRIESRFGQQHSEREVLESLSVLLRRIAVNRYPRTQVASLTGNRWLQFLDSAIGTAEFSQGSGRTLAEAPYNPSLRIDNIPDVMDLCRRWLAAEFRRRVEN